MLHCDRLLLDLLCDYVEGTLGVDEKAEVERHLASCPQCTTFLNTYRATPHLCREMLKQEMSKAMPPQMSSALMDFLRAKCKK